MYVQIGTYIAQMSRSCLDVGPGHVLSKRLYSVDNESSKLDEDHSKVEDREDYWEETVGDAERLKVRQVNSEEQHHPDYIDHKHSKENTVAKAVQLVLEVISGVVGNGWLCPEDSISHSFPEVVFVASEATIPCFLHDFSSVVDLQLT